MQFTSLAATEGIYLRVRRHLSKCELAELGRFRVRVYKEGGVIIPKSELDEFNGWTDEIDQGEQAYHVLAYSGSNLIGAGRLSVHDTIGELPDAFLFGQEMQAYAGSFGSLNRLVIDPEFRGRGLAAMIDDFRCQIAEGIGVKTLVGCALGGNRRARLEDLGFQIIQQLRYPTIDFGEKNLFKAVKVLNTPNSC